jgi:hypothetical protein
MAEFLGTIPEPAPPRDFQEFLRNKLSTMKDSSDPKAFAEELFNKFLEYDEYWKELLKDSLTRWLFLCHDDPRFAERSERWKREGIDPEGTKEFLNYLTARTERAEERLFEKLNSNRTKVP